MGVYNSSHTLRCNGMQGPFNSTLDSFEWRNSNGVIMNDTRRSTRVIPSGLDGYYYRQFFFNTSLDIQNLRVEDAGIYYCSMSVNVTYPDGPNNSSAILTNTTSFALWIRGNLKYCYIAVVYSFNARHSIPVVVSSLACIPIFIMSMQTIKLNFSFLHMK